MATDQLLDLIDGMTQDERRIIALDPGYIKIDDRKISDLLKFISDFSGQVNFYNESNQIDGDWQDFLKSDINILVLLITEFDLTSHLIQFEKLETKVQFASGDKEAKTALKYLFSYLHELIDLLISTCKKLEDVNTYDKASLELKSIIKGFNQEIAEIISYTDQAEATFGKQFAFKHEVPLPEHKVDIKQIFKSADEIKLQSLSALPYIKQTFSNLRSKYNNFLAVTAFYFKDHDLLKHEYHPHLALCITFLKLFQHLQNQMNKISSDHLDFYYKEILEIRLNGAKPDSVHIVFDPSNLDQVQLKKGELIQAEVDSNLLYYALDENQVITKARIIELKSLILDEHTQVISTIPENQDVKEIEIYKSNHKSIQASNFFEQQSGIKPWPVLGESQFELADEDRTMEDTEIGILLSSPVLYQTEGNRSILLTIYFESASFDQLFLYFKNFANVTGKLLQAVSYELLSDTFIISFTSSNGWTDIKRYTVKVNMSDKNIEIKFELSPVETGIDIYSPEIHGENYGLDWPVIRLLLNNYSTHNPFSFLRKLTIERVSFSVNVTGYRTVKLQNNVGNLSPDNPFHPFGPQPVIGSFIDIKNTNIFNRFTKDFCIKLEWIDLPRDIGGWETYLKEYDANITNDSFKVKLSALSQGKFKPALTKRQEFNLFSMERGDFGAEILSDISEIKNVDIKKLELPNKPLLANEAAVSDANFSEGAIRLEFSSPQEAFGSKLYPQIFPEAVLYNSRRFTKNRPLPNPPNIPVVKSITIDYTLEHSEVLVKTVKNEDSALKIIHQYPFGYERVYPESDKQPYHFIPDYNYENNLYIGIKDLYPKQELSLLFQLQKSNFTDTAKEPDPIFWSYLYENTWVDIDKHQVIYDTTNNFINTGIVKIKMPEDVQMGNTLLSPDLYWLRAASKGQWDVRSKLIGIYPHACTATRIISNPSHINHIKLPANSIKSFSTKIEGLNNMYQLFASYGGKTVEKTDQYYVRVSERLRHKNRLVTNRDIEEAILEEFPQLLMAKSISPEPAFDAMYSPGNKKIRIIIVPKDIEVTFFTNHQPKVNLADLYQIKTFVKASISPFVDIEIENPVYEKIKLVGMVKFNGKEPADRGFYIKKLNEDIQRYLCPWLFESSSSFKIGSQIYITELVNYIKKRPYVEYLTGFSVLHFYNWHNERTGETLSGMNDLGRNNMSFIRGSVPEAVIIPSEEHMFTVLDEAQYADAVQVGIGNLSIADELIIYDKSLSSTDEDTKASPIQSDEQEYINLFIDHNLK